MNLCIQAMCKRQQCMISLCISTQLQHFFYNSFHIFERNHKLRVQCNLDIFLQFNMDYKLLCKYCQGNCKYIDQLLACIYSMVHYTYNNDLSLFVLLQQQHQLENLMHLLNYCFVYLRVLYYQLLSIIQFLLKVWRDFLLHTYSKQFF